MRIPNRRAIIIIASAVLVLVLLEVYAHTYVQLHVLSVVHESEARYFFPFGRSTGTYAFSSSGCQWLVVWRADEASESMNYGFIRIFKVVQNRSLFTLNTDLVVRKLESRSNNTGWFYAELDEVLYESNCTTARMSYYFGEIDTYEIDFGLVVQVYEETLLATWLREKIRIPLETTIYYGP